MSLFGPNCLWSEWNFSSFFIGNHLFPHRGNIKFQVDLKVFVILIPKEGWACMAAPVVMWTTFAHKLDQSRNKIKGKSHLYRTQTYRYGPGCMLRLFSNLWAKVVGITTCAHPSFGMILKRSQLKGGVAVR